jgi:hypothetical protein
MKARLTAADHSGSLAAHLDLGMKVWSRRWLNSGTFGRLDLALGDEVEWSFR